MSTSTVDLSEQAIRAAQKRIKAKIVQHTPAGLHHEDLNKFCMDIDIGRFDNLPGNVRRRLTARCKRLGKNGPWVSMSEYSQWEKSVAAKKNGDTTPQNVPATMPTKTTTSTKEHTFEGDLRITIEGEGLTITAKVVRVSITLAVTVGAVVLGFLVF